MIDLREPMTEEQMNQQTEDSQTAISGAIIDLFLTLPVDRQTALLKDLDRLVGYIDNPEDDDIPFPIAWIDGEPVYREVA